jgi:ABC-type nitrate/sulfonate/bicarbonate transport system ATPase subunit
LSMIDVENLTFAYGSEPDLFKDFRLYIDKGDTWSIIGPSGCGKTTLLYLLAGLYHPGKGTVFISNKQLTRPRPLTGLVLQDHGLLPWATVRQNVALGVKIRRFYGPDGKHVPLTVSANKIKAEEQIDYWMQRLGLDGLSNKYPSQLSGGQRQRTAIARSLLLEPDLILLDEPFSALDAPTRDDLERILIDLTREQNLTMVLVTHDIDVAVTMGEKILVLADKTNHTAQIVENSCAGRLDERTSDSFKAVSDSLRQLIGKEI